MRSIQTKFIILILGCVLLSSLVIGSAGILSAKTVVDEDSSQIMNLLCGQKAEQINALLSRIEQSVDTLASYALGQLDSVQRLKEDPAYLTAYTKQIQDIAINAADSTEGALAVYLRFNPEFSPPTAGLFWSKTSRDGSLQELPPTDLSNYSPEDVEHVGWYYTPVRSGKPTWMLPYQNQNINVEMISYVIPLYQDNVTVGVVGMDIDFQVLKAIVDATRVYESGYAFLTDSDANLTHHGHQSQLPPGNSLSDLEDSLDTVARELRRDSSGSFLLPYTWRGEEKKLAFASLRNNMRLAITAPVSEIDGAKNSLIVHTGVALVTISALAVGLTVLLTRKLIRPLKALNVAAQKIAAGDLSIDLNYQTKDEVGTLADSFQRTVAHLRQYIDYINGLAYRDGLTGARNKAAYQEATARLEEQMRLGRPEFAVILFDLNGLKAINDTYGHDFGDMVIMNACQLISKIFQHSPVYRIGGDEFLTILEGADYHHYPALLARFQEATQEYNRYAQDNGKLSIARGIALYQEDTDLTFGDVFRRADNAMYQNKAAMKSRSVPKA